MLGAAYVDGSWLLLMVAAYVDGSWLLVDVCCLLLMVAGCWLMFAVYC